MNIPKIEELNAANCRSCTFAKYWPEFYKYLCETYKRGSFSEKLAMYYRELKEPPVCVVCGKPVKFINFRAGWRQTCSNKCRNLDPSTQQKREKTCLERYGLENPGKVKAFQFKMKKTCLERYGLENPGWSPESQTKIKTTNMKRYGVEHPMQSSIVRQKSKQTCLEKYGVEHNTSNDQIKDKIKETNKTRYGATGYASPELMAKVLKTCADKYGSKPIINCSQIPEIKNRILRTRREQVVLNHDDIIGYTENYDWICKCPHPECTQCQEKIYITSPDIKRNRERIGAEVCTILLPIKSQHSTIELWVANILNKYHINYEIGNRSILNGKEIDIYCPDLNIGIECNGAYWHSTRYKDKKYHEDKTKLANSLGIRLYHVWEDWVVNTPDIIESMILNWIGKSPNRIFARKCQIKKVPGNVGRDFLSHNHIQGNSGYAIGYGLYYEGELISLMTFGHKRGCAGSFKDGKKDDEWELIRFCSKLNTSVVGAAGKLLKHFIKTQQPTTIYSYASQDISVGNVYKTLGFVSDNKVTSSYWYIDPITMKRYHRTSFTKNRIVKLGWYPDKTGWTETRAMEEHGYIRIYDAGQTKWILTI